MDRTVPESKWIKQEDAFRRMLRLARVHQPLILHLRGPPEDVYGSDVNALCMMLMEEICKRDQKIHLHCFKGREIIVKAWLRKFPNAYFGVTAAVRSFNEEQLAGLRAIPRDKLLLDSDAPYFPYGNAQVSTPAYLGELAAFVAIHLDMRALEVMKLTVRNARALYGV